MLANISSAVTRRGNKAAKSSRVFAHYVLGRLAFLFFMCHPGTLATFSDGQAYLLNRYPNRDLVTTEGQLQDQRRHCTPRSPADFAMRTGVPDEFLNGDSPDNWAPDWAPSLEERFHNTVKGWLRQGLALAKHAKRKNPAPAEGSAPAGLAFVPSPAARCRMDTRAALANDRQRERWTLLARLGSSPRCSSGALPPAFGRRRAPGNGLRGPCTCHGHPRMLLGFRGRGGGGGGFHFGRRLFSGGASSGQRGTANLEGEPAPEVVGSDGTQAGVATVRGLPQERGAEIVSAPPGAKASAEAKARKSTRTLEASKRPASPSDFLSSLLGGAVEAYDSAVSFVGCALVTSSLGKRYLNAYDGHYTVPASAIRDGRDQAAMGGSAFDLVGFSNIDPFEASGRRGGDSYRRTL